jgi:MFS family permease
MTVFATPAPPEPVTARAHPDPGAALAAAGVLGFFVASAGRDRRQRCPAVDPGRSGRRADRAAVGRKRLHRDVRRTAADGRSADRPLGRTYGLGSGVAVFVLASAACALAPTVALLVAARFVQGAGAAVTMTACTALVAAVLWLCSDAAALVLGHALVVDGGQTVGVS